MKYNSTQSEEQNARLWRLYSQIQRKEQDYSRLPPEIQSAAQQLNELLTRIEAETQTRIGPTLRLLFARKDDANDPLQNFEVLLTLSYGLLPSDPDWDAQAEDNLLFSQTVSLYEVTGTNTKEGFGRPVARAAWEGWSGQAPCWSFMLLMQFSGIAWDDLARIANIQCTFIVKTDEAPIPVVFGTQHIPVTAPPLKNI